MWISNMNQRTIKPAHFLDKWAGFLNKCIQMAYKKHQIVELSTFSMSVHQAQTEISQQMFRHYALFREKLFASRKSIPHAGEKTPSTVCLCWNPLNWRRIPPIPPRNGWQCFLFYRVFPKLDVLKFHNDNIIKYFNWIFCRPSRHFFIFRALLDSFHFFLSSKVQGIAEVAIK